MRDIYSYYNNQTVNEITKHLNWKCEDYAKNFKDFSIKNNKTTQEVIIK